MVLDDPITAVGVAGIVFFVLLGALYIVDVPLVGRRWFGTIFLLIGLTMLLLLIGQPGLSGVSIAVIAALVAKGQLERQLQKRGLVTPGAITKRRAP